MERNNSHIVVLYIVLLMSTTTIRAEQPVKIQPWIQWASYCVQDDGAFMFQFTVGLTYTNTSSQPLIIPRFAVVSGYRVERNGKEILRIHGPIDSVSSQVWDSPQPPRDLFDVLAPGQTDRTAVWYETIPVVSSGIPTGLQPGGEYSIYLVRDHRSASPNRRVTPKHWFDTGVLLTDRIEAGPIQVQIPARQPTAVCKQPPTVSIRKRG